MDLNVTDRTTSPPPHIRPGILVVQATALHKSGLHVGIDTLRVYPMGVLVDITVRTAARPRDEWRSITAQLRADPGMGLTAWARHLPPDDVPAADLGVFPMAIFGDTEAWRLGYWICPLAPSGELVIGLSWPERNLTWSHQVDADRLRAAAEQSVVLWDAADPSPRPGHPL